MYIVNVDYTENVRISVVCKEKDCDGFVKKVVEVTSGKAEMSDKENIEYYSSDKEIVML